MIAEDVLAKLEEAVAPYGGRVMIEYISPMNTGTLPWSCTLHIGRREGSWGEGTGSTLLEAVEDAFEDLERVRDA